MFCSGYRTLFGNFGLRMERPDGKMPGSERPAEKRRPLLQFGRIDAERERRLRLEEESSSETWSHKWKLAVSSAIMRGTLR